MNCSHIKVSVVVIAMLLTHDACGSEDTIGPNGINSAGLENSTGAPLTGDGIPIGQVETGRPGKPAFDMPMNVDGSIDPREVFFRDGPAVANMNITEHAEWVAGIMISTNTMHQRQGVAPQADLFSSANNPTPMNAQDTVALAAQHLVAQGNVRAINLSIGVAEAGMVLDGRSLETSFIDWSARQHDVLYVVAGNITGPPTIPIPTDNFNGMTIAMSKKDESGVYRIVDDANDYQNDVEAVGERTSVSLIAPGRDVELRGTNGSNTTQFGTSLAAPHVTGTVALLQEYAETQIAISKPRWDVDARHHQVMKAVLMNSADKIKDDETFTHPNIEKPVPAGGFLGMERTVLKQPEEPPGNQTPTWFDSDAHSNAFIPLDLEMGAGHLNAKRALQQFSTGEFDSDAADVPAIGWDYGITSGEDDINRYAFDQKLLGGSFISITLAFDRVVQFATDTAPLGQYNTGDSFKLSGSGPLNPINDDQINDLDLYLVPKGAFNIGQAIAESISTESTIEHIFFQIPETDEYEIWVHQFDADILGGQTYGLAWWALGDEPVVVQPGDFDGDGDVDGADFVVWQTNFPTQSGATLATGDADGDGDVDGADFVIWQTNFPFTPSAAVPVPEPGGFLVAAFAALGLTLVRRRFVS